MRHLAKDVLLYGLGDALLKVAAVVTVPVYTRLFDPSDYGVWTFTSTMVGVLSAVLIVGGDSAYARFWFEARDDASRRLLTSTWFGFLAAWSAAIVVLLVPAGGLFSRWAFGTGRHQALFWLALLAAPITLMNTMCGQALRNQFRPSLFVALNAATAVMTVAFGIVGAAVLDLGLAGVLGGALAAAVAMLPVRLWTVRGLLGPLFSWGLLRKLLSFGVPLVPASIAYWVFLSSDRVVLAKLSTLEQLGLYAVANNLTAVLAMLHGAFGQAWSPHAVRAYEESPEALSAFAGRIMTYLLVGFGFGAVCITAFAPEALRLLTTPAYQGASRAVGPLALGFVALATTQITAIGISLAKRTRYLALFSWGAAILNLILNLLLVPRWGMVGSAWATALSYTFLTVGYMLVSQRMYQVAYETRRAARLLALVIVFTGGATLLDRPAHRGVLVAAFVLLLWPALKGARSSR